MNLKYILSFNLVVFNVIGLPHFIRIQDITLTDLSFRTIITSDYKLIIGCDNGNIYIY